jgi:hypothetical protein
MNTKNEDFNWVLNEDGSLNLTWQLVYEYPSYTGIFGDLYKANSTEKMKVPGSVKIDLESLHKLYTFLYSNGIKLNNLETKRKESAAEKKILEEKKAKIASLEKELAQLKKEVA